MWLVVERCAYLFGFKAEVEGAAERLASSLPLLASSLPSSSVESLNSSDSISARFAAAAASLFVSADFLALLYLLFAAKYFVLKSAERLNRVIFLELSPKNMLYIDCNLLQLLLISLCGSLFITIILLILLHRAIAAMQDVSLPDALSMSAKAFGSLRLRRLITASPCWTIASSGGGDDVDCGRAPALVEVFFVFPITTADFSFFYKPRISGV